MSTHQWAVAACAIAMGIGETAVEAGIFSKRTPDPCQQCQCPTPAPKRKLFDLPEPPRAGTATAIPALITSPPNAQNNLNNPANIPPAPVPPASDPRVDQIERDVKVIKEQLKVLATLLQESK